MKEVILKGYKTITWFRLMAIATAVLAFAFLWFTQNKVFGAGLAILAISEYALSVALSFDVLKNGGSSEFDKISKLELNEIYSHHAEVFEKIIKSYTFVEDISTRLSGEFQEYKFENIKNSTVAKEFFQKKDDWIIENSKK